MRSIRLAEETAQRVDEQVRGGHASSGDAIVQVGLAVLEREQSKLAAVRAALVDGEESGIAEEGGFERARAHIRQLAAARRTR